MELKLKPEEIRNDLVKKVEELAGVNVFACYQCGKCSSGCPSVPYMEILPNQVLRLLQFGKVERILRTNTHWVCASCFVCSTRCPKDIDIAAIMEALRQIELRKNQDYLIVRRIDTEEMKEFPPIALVSAFRKLTA
ncbi:4Fe-4S dicluster domain-containing protein [candidate division WOR-3 bacterium]|nr:4Fe-4S dicluster domain-containing protein [candidate division WOR-3 bacterium]